MSPSLFKPLVKTSGKILEFTWRCFLKPFSCVCDAFNSLPNSGLYFCGFSLVLVPLIVAYWVTALAVLLSELLILCLLGLILGLIFALFGVWAGPITAVGQTGISLIRLPHNLFYHAVVTYRTVLLRTNLKIISFLLLPFIHFLVPVFTFLLSLIFYSFKYFSLSFVGHPLKPWLQISDNMKVGWKKFATDMDTFFTNYGDPSGIPDGWDGRVYGLPIDPVVFVISLIIYLIVFIPFSLVTFSIFLIKAAPIFLGTLTQFWKSLNISASLAWYRKFIENYSKIKPLHSYEKKLKGYSSWVKPLNPSKLSKLIGNYCGDFSPLKMIPDNMGISILCLWIPILMALVVWMLGLVLVLTVPPLSFLVALLAWLAGWLIVLPLWPLLYVAGWVFIIFGLPCLYLLVWVCILVCPWLLSIFGSLLGPIIALKVPIFIISANFYNPLELGNSIKESLKLALTLLRRVDKWTGSLSIGGFRLTNAENDTKTNKKEEREVLRNYWDLVVDSCIMARVEIVSLKWLEEDDIASASATSLIAVPGVAAVNLLSNSVNSGGLVWNDSARCSQANRDFQDNVSNLFWPKLMEARLLMARLSRDDLQQAASFIKASLCDGDDDKSPELTGALGAEMTEEQRQAWMRIRARVENIVHSLLRVEKFQQNLSKIISSTPDETTVM